MLAYIWQRKSVTHLKRDEYLCFLLPCLKRRECCSQAMLKPNEKAPPAGRPLPLSFPCVLRVGTVRRFSCGSHRPAYSWLKKKKGGMAGELLDALGPPMPKEKVVNCCLKKKKKNKHPVGNWRWPQGRLSTGLVLTRPLVWLGPCGSPATSCASPFRHLSSSEPPMGEPDLPIDACCWGLTESTLASQFLRFLWHRDRKKELGTRKWGRHGCRVLPKSPSPFRARPPGGRGRGDLASLGGLRVRNWSEHAPFQVIEATLASDSRGHNLNLNA